MSAKILVVDDTPQNVKLLTDLLVLKGYTVTAATNGQEALESVKSDRPDMVLLDVMMPILSGYDVCRRLRADPATALLPIVLVTSLDPHEERVKGIEAGADDFLSKPINQPELFARVKSLLRVKSLQDDVSRQARELVQWNEQLETRVQEQVGQIARLGKMKNFFSPQIAELILAAGGEQLLNPHRQLVTVVFLDLRGFTSFTDSAEPEEVIEMLRAYHAQLGRLIVSHGGTLEHFAGDGMMVFFNDPVPVERPVERAARMAVEMQSTFGPVRAGWAKRGHTLGLGIGISEGYATLGAIGFEGRWDYAVIGTVANQAARLCADARAGQILIDQATLARIEDLAVAEPLGELVLKGISRPVSAFNLVSLRE